MKITVVVESEADYTAWLAKQKNYIAPPEEEKKDDAAAKTDTTMVAAAMTAPIK
jgi:heme/copper-type cytochrome/quinol oxidase subunit 2